MSEIKYSHLHQWMWWGKGKCVVEVIKTGHFPTTGIVRLPNGSEIEVDIDELGENPRVSNQLKLDFGDEAERRIDVIGSNGNEGLHYKE